MSLPKHLKKYFWDTDFERLEWESRKAYIAQKILEHGDVQAVRWLIAHTDRKLLKKTLCESRGFSAKSANFWVRVFKINPKEVQCLKKSYQKMQGEHWQR